MPSQASAKISALDVLQLSRFKPAVERDGNGGFTSGRFRLRLDDDVLYTNGWGFWMSWWIHTEKELPPAWGEPMLMQIFSVSGGLRLKWEADTVMEEEKEQMKAVTRVDSFDDSVITKAGIFDGCLKLKTVISGLGDAGFDKAKKQDMNDELRRIGTQYIWLAPNVGIVKFLYEHPNDMQTEIELVDYNVAAGDPLHFPLSSSNNWRYQCQDEVAVHRELIRVFPCLEEGLFMVSSSKHIEGKQAEADADRQ
jgi:hypothetical protein